jgi:hypothetical protein
MSTENRIEESYAFSNAIAKDFVRILFLLDYPLRLV